MTLSRVVRAAAIGSLVLYLGVVIWGRVEVANSDDRPWLPNEAGLQPEDTAVPPPQVDSTLEVSCAGDLAEVGLGRATLRTDDVVSLDVGRLPDDLRVELTGTDNDGAVVHRSDVGRLSLEVYDPAGRLVDESNEPLLPGTDEGLLTLAQQDGGVIVWAGPRLMGTLAMGNVAGLSVAGPPCDGVRATGGTAGP